MPARLLLVRHAHIECGSAAAPLLCGSHDAGLSTTGWRQVERLRARLADEPPAVALYSSQLLRAVQTARAAPSHLLAGMRRLRSLQEIHCGALEGMPIEEVRRRYPALWEENLAQRNEDFRWPGGESYRRFRRRVLCIVSAIAARHPDGRVLVFTHAGVVNQVLGSLSGRSAAQWEHPRPRNCSITEVLWDGDVRRVVRFDDCGTRDAA